MSFLLNNSSAGLTPVVEWLVDRYASKNLLTSAWETPMAFRSDRFSRSTSPLALGHKGVVWPTFRSSACAEASSISSVLNSSGTA